MSKKQIVVLVVCLAVIAVAVLTIARRGRKEEGIAKRAQQSKKVRCIEVDSLQPVEMTWAEWEALPLKDEESGYRVKEGKTLALAMQCPLCGEVIPVPYGDPPHKCPKCGGEFE